MEKMKTRFIIAVTGRLSAAADSTAKVELIEELSENLFSRWQDLVSGGDGNTRYSDSRDGVYSSTVPTGTNAGDILAMFNQISLESGS